MDVARQASGVVDKNRAFAAELVMTQTEPGRTLHESTWDLMKKLSYRLFCQRVSLVTDG